jgi:hypothetical protein
MRLRQSSSNLSKAEAAATVNGVVSAVVVVGVVADKAAVVRVVRVMATNFRKSRATSARK